MMGLHFIRTLRNLASSSKPNQGELFEKPVPYGNPDSDSGGLPLDGTRARRLLLGGLAAFSLFILGHPLSGGGLGAEDAVETWRETTIETALPCGTLPGDCASSGAVTVNELQRAVAMNLGLQAPSCNADADGSGNVSPEEVAQVAQAFLGNLLTAYGVGVSLSPASADIAVGGSQTFTAALLGCGEDSGVDWSVQEGAAGGTVTAGGLYTAPSTPGLYHVVATARADGTKSAKTAVSVTQRTVLVDQTVSPSASDQVVEADGGSVALLIPGDSLEAAAVVKVEKVDGLTVPADMTPLSSWYRFTVDGGPVPWAMSVEFRNIAARAESEPEEGTPSIVSSQGSFRPILPTSYGSGRLRTTSTMHCHTYGAALVQVPVRQTWDAKPHFTIHYYLTGGNAAPTDYQAENSSDPSVPDFVEDVGAFLEGAYTRYTSAPSAGMGLRAPYTTEEKGQVYIANYATSEWGKWDGHIYVATKFNSKTELGANWAAVGGLDKTLLQWEMAHELFHAVQNKYRNIMGMGRVLWLSESLCDSAAQLATPDSQSYLDVKLVNYGNWLNFQYWDKGAGDETKYMGAGFLDYEADKHPGGFDLNVEFMEREYSGAYSQPGALDLLIRWHLYYKKHFAEYVEFFYFDESSPLAQLYFPVTKRVPKVAYRFRNGTMGCPSGGNQYAYEKDRLEIKLFTLGGSGGVKPWTADYCAVFPNRDTGRPTNDKVWKYQVEMKTTLNANEVAKLFLSKDGRIVGNQVMPAKGTKVTVELGRTKVADTFYVLVVNPNTTSSPSTAHQVEVTPELAITNANGYFNPSPYLFCAGYAVNFQVAVVGGSPPLQFSIVDGALPPECSINPDTGLITGNISGDASTNHNFRVEVRDSRNEMATGDFSVIACRANDTFACVMCWYREEGNERGAEPAPIPDELFAPSLALGGAAASPGDTVQLPLTLTGGGSTACALAVDVTYDPQALAFLGAQVGTAGSASGKEVIFSTPSSGVARVALYGLNQTPVPDGLVATLSFSVSTGAGSDQALGMNCSASDCSGNAMASTCSAGSVTVQGCDLTCTASASPTSGSPPLVVSFSASASGNTCGSATFDWDFGDESPHSDLQNPSHTYSSPGSYAWTMTASVQNVRFCIRTGTVEVSGACSPPSITVHPQSQTIPSGQTATLNVAATGTAPLSYQWYRGTTGSTSTPVGTDSPSFTTQALTVTTSYWVRVTNSCGHADSSTATVTVDAGCSLSCSASATPGSGAAPLAVTFSATATPVNCAFESPAPGISTSKSATSVILRPLGRETPEESGSQSVTRSFGRSASKSPLDDGSGRNSGIEPIAVGEAVTVLTSGVPVNGAVAPFEWALYKITLPPDALVLEVETTGATSDLDLYVRYGSEPTQDLWDYRPYSTSGDETVIVTPSSSPAPLQGGDWFIGVYGFVDGGSFTLTATVTSGGGPVTALTSGVGVPGSVAESEWKYYSIEVPSGASQLEVKTTNATADMDLYVRFGDLPDSQNYDYRPYTLDGNETVTVTPVSSPRPLQAGTWYFGVHSFWSGSYTITATLTGGSICTLACTVTVPSTGTAGSPVTFTSTATPSDCTGSPTYAWTFGDGQSSSLQNPSHTYAVAGTYPWTLTTTVQGITCTKGGSVTISSASGTTYAWTFGDGQSSSQQNPSHTYAADGTYTWSMTATWNGKACSKTGTVTAGAGGAIPGDCDGSGSVSIGEVQKAINMFLGTLAPGCGVDCSGDGTVSIGEVQKAINAFLGVATSC